MKYVSTRGDAPVLGFDDVLLTGLARDGGLYVPETWPQLTRDEIAAYRGAPFADIAVDVISRFTGDTIARTDLKRMADAAYAAFRHPAVTPLVQIGPNRWVLELFHGPTLAFKDVAMQLLARMMDHVLEARGTTATIVGATSGDTGGAAIEAFRNSTRVNVVILYPERRVSDVQRRMMTTPQEPNVATLEVDGTFDDCQALLKAMFNDFPFRERVGLSAVNSINWARIVAQTTYYFAAATALGAPDRAVSFVVPTGNFGDIFAGYVARRMGLPIARLIIASNDNDILPRVVATGAYEKRGVVATTSPSMDIQVSSNFERYLFEAQDRDAARVRAQMASLAQSGRFEMGDALDQLKADFDAGAASETDVAGVIKTVQRQTGYLVEPHTACAIYAGERIAAEAASTQAPQVVLATAHPAKFPEAMSAIVGSPTPLPSRLSGLMEAPERTVPVANDLSKVEQAIEAIIAGSKVDGTGAPMAEGHQ